MERKEHENKKNAPDFRVCLGDAPVLAKTADRRRGRPRQEEGAAPAGGAQAPGRLRLLDGQSLAACRPRPGDLGGGRAARGRGRRQRAGLRGGAAGFVLGAPLPFQYFA